MSQTSPVSPSSPTSGSRTGGTRTAGRSARRRRTTAAVLVGALALSSVGLAVGTAVAQPDPAPAGTTLTGTLEPGGPAA
ncbi:hypothetical protein [Streptomyces sp. WG-D5]